MTHIQIRTSYGPVPSAPRTSSQGIWRDYRTARALLGHTTRAALGARRVGENLAIALDEDILATATHATGWVIPIQTRRGEQVAIVDVSIRVPSLLDWTEVAVTCDEATMATTRIVATIVDALHDATGLARSLIATLTQQSDRQAVLTSGRISGPRSGPQRETAGSRRGDPSQPGRSLTLFGAENRT